MPDLCCDRPLWIGPSCACLTILFVNPTTISPHGAGMTLAVSGRNTSMARLTFILEKPVFRAPSAEREVQISRVVTWLRLTVALFCPNAISTCYCPRHYAPHHANTHMLGCVNQAAVGARSGRETDRRRPR